MDDKILEMKHVTKKFPGVIALNDVSIDVRKGEILGIVGENGAGKSTLMKVLSGSYTNKEFEGEIWINGEKQSFSCVSDSKAAGIEMVYQEANAMYEASVAENIFVGNYPGRFFVDYKKLYRDTQDLLDQLGLEVSPKTTAGSLNSGQLQLMSIVRAISSGPRIMVLDEPSTALTDTEVDILMNFMEKLKKSGVSLIYISHKLEEIFRICDRVTIIRDGNVITTGGIKSFTQDTLVEGMIGRKVENLYVKGKHTAGEPVLEVNRLSVPHPTIDHRNIVDHISFQLHKGEILGFGGLVGAGRSETLGAVFGQLTKGVVKEIKVNGKPVEINSPQDAIEAGIGFVTEERKLTGFIETMSIKDNLSLIALKDLPGRFFIDRKVEKEKTKVIFDRMKVKAPSLDSMVINLSGGNQQKVVLGKWLAKNPRILFIDEPTKGIDVGAKAEFYKIMDELVSAGVSIIMVSSDMPELVSISDRVLVLSNGKITGEFTKEEVTQTNIMKAAIAERRGCEDETE